MCKVCSGINPFLENCAYSGNDDQEIGLINQSNAGLLYSGFENSSAESRDVVAGVSSKYSMEVGGYFHGEIDSFSDRDWVRVELEAGQTYTFALAAIGASDDRLNNGFLNLRDQNGNILASHDDLDDTWHNSFLNSEITYTASSDQVVFLDAGAGDSPSKGKYGLSVTMGETASYDIHMGAGALLRPNRTWSEESGQSVTIDWAFRTSRNPDSRVSQDTNNPWSFLHLDAKERASVETAFSYIDSISGVNFRHVNPNSTSDDATILVANYNHFDARGAYAYYPGDYGDRAGDIWLNRAAGVGSNWDGDMKPGTWSYLTIMHEAGHALGLAHPGTYNASVSRAFLYGSANFFLEDSLKYSVMSYFGQHHTGASDSGRVEYPDSMLMMDILAIHQLYGADYSHNAGNSVYGFNSNMAGSIYDFTKNDDPFLTIWDGSGNDTIDVSAYGGEQAINLNEGTFSDVLGFTGTLSIAIDAKIENAIGGTGADRIVGNKLGNFIDANSGDDRVWADAGNDIIRGRAGDDIIFGGNGADILLGDNGADEIYGEFGNDVARGGHGSDLIKGGNGNDRLFGGLSGDDEMHGGAGNDLIRASRENDIVFGGEGDDQIFGGAGFDTLTGGAGNDVMSGAFNADRFVFEEGHGHDIIVDFDAKNDFERLDLRGVSSLTMKQNGDDVLIVTGAESSILLLNTDLVDLGSEDFV